MLGILWLTVWFQIVVGDTYDEYWYSSSDGRAKFMGMNWQRNFSEVLRDLADSYGQGDTISISSAKNRLRAIKVYEYTGSSDDFDPQNGQVLPLPEGSEYCSMGRHTRVDCNHCTCVGGQLYLCTGMICPETPHKPEYLSTCEEGTKRQIDSCNFCYCQDGRELCTTKDCGQKHNIYLRENCEEGSQRIVNGCNRCVCIRGEEYCSNNICGADKKVLPEFEFKSTSRRSDICMEEAEKHNDACNSCTCFEGMILCEYICQDIAKAISRNQPDYEEYDDESSNSESLEKESCQKGDKRTLDSCYECYCAHRVWICENINCEDVYNTEEVDYNNIGICNEGDALKIDSCYGCDCLDGNWICEKKCDFVEFHNNNTESYYNDLTKLRNNQLQCITGEIKHKDCNLCICQSHQWVCEQNACHRDADIQRRTRVCDINEVKYEECNRCICRHNRWVCENKTCDYDDSSNSESSVENLLYLESCRNDDKRKLDACNKCYCRNGQWFCENKDCGILEILANPDTEFGHLQTWSALGDPVCSKKKKRQIDACNYCYCRQGQWFCENKQCVYDKGQPPLSDDSFKFEKCTRGSIRYDKCNRCICPAGTWICEQKTCNIRPKIIRNMNNGTDILKLLYLQSCHNEEQRKLDLCNKCYCRLGQWFCENKECQNNEIYGTHLNNSMSLNFTLRPVCRQGRKRQIDACNYCFCLNGQWLCENEYCSPTPVAAAASQQPFYLHKQCNYGYKIKIDACNYCFCNKNSRFICSKNTCSDLPYHGSAGDKIFHTSEVECVEGTRRPYDNCNYCYCISGQEFCTLKTCPSRFQALPLFELSCKPGVELPNPDSCNECVCIDSLIACTNYECLELTAKGLRNSFLCSEGTRRTIDHCSNYCICVDKEEFCTQKFCTTIDSVPELLFPEAECDLGESLSDPDACNECICLNNEIACTTLPCPEKYGLRSSQNCIDGTRRKVDGCNYCECFNGLEFCTNKTCPITTSKPPFVYSGPECEPGISLPKKDSCNECICIDSDILCSNQSCAEKKSGIQSKCIDGTRSKINGCNYCICFNGLEFCTQKEVCPPPSPKPISKYLVPGPECEVGITLPDVDSCNECMCLNYEVVCTKKICAKRSTDGGNSANCIKGEKRNVGDGCNYCICIDGQEFCTSRACLSTSTTTNIACKKGEHHFNDCNICICILGKLTCTEKPCNHERNGFSESTTTFKRNSQYSPPRSIKSRLTEDGRFTKQKTHSGKICTHGNVYKLEDDDPNCPNSCICDNNEILCTNRPCRRKSKKNKRGPINMAQFINSGCIENEKLPSDDPCSTCICRNGRKICTVLACVDNDDLMTEEELLTGKKGKNRSHTKIDISFCTPFTFFSPDNNRFCRNCFCLHNGLALCLLHLCKYSKDIANNPPIAPLEPSCTPGDTGYPTKCVVCTCSDDAKWICNRIELELCQDRECDAKDEFQMGMDQSCASCKCAVKEWYCSVNEKPCSGNVKCPIGTFIRNPQQPCSICLCGGYEDDSNNLCFTEVKCVHQVQNNLKRI